MIDYKIATSEALARLPDLCGLTASELSRRMGRDESFVGNAVSLGKVPVLTTFVRACNAAGIPVVILAPNGAIFQLVVREKSEGEQVEGENPTHA